MSKLFEEDDEILKKNSRTEFADLFENSLKGVERKLKMGDQITCEVLAVGTSEIFVATGTIQDGVVLRNEFDSSYTPKVGDAVSLYVTQVKSDQVFLSPNPTAKNLADDIEDAYDMELPIEGRVSEICNGGFRVMIHGKKGFCPISQMDIKRIDNPEEYIGKKFDFVVTQFEGGRNIVVSRRRLLDQKRDLAQQSFQDKVKVGDLLPGKVVRVEKFGAFVEVAGGVDGLVHVSEMAWSRVQDPSDLVKPNDTVSVKVLKIEELDGRLKLSLSMKQAESEPWLNLPSDIQVGNVLQGRVTKCMKFGAFVELFPGIEGLIPLSEMSYTKRVSKPEELVKEGDQILVMVKDVLSEQKRLTLSLKDAEGDPWSMVLQNYPVGKIVEATVERKEPYGVFLKLEAGIVGLMPKGKTKDVPEYAIEKMKLGDRLKVQVAEIRFEERKLSLAPPGEEVDESWRDFSKGSKSMGTLGDQFKAVLEKSKKN